MEIVVWGEGVRFQVRSRRAQGEGFRTLLVPLVSVGFRFVFEILRDP